MGTSIPSLAWIDKPEASLFRYDGWILQEKALIFSSATKLTWGKQLGLTKGVGQKVIFSHCTTSREKKT